MTHLRLVQPDVDQRLPQVSRVKAAHIAAVPALANAAEPKARALTYLHALVKMLPAVAETSFLLAAEHSSSEVPNRSRLTIENDTLRRVTGVDVSGGYGFEWYRVQGLRGVFSARRSDLALTIVGVSANAQLAEVMQALSSVAPKAVETRVAIDRAMICAEEFAAVKPHGCVRVLSDDESNLAAQCSPESRKKLEDNDYEILIVPRQKLDAVAEQAAELSGTTSLLVKFSVSQNQTVASWKPELKDDPGPVLLAVAEFLRLSGQRVTAKTLVDAWQFTLKNGFHTASIPHAGPYTWQIDDSTFLQKVASEIQDRDRLVNSGVVNTPLINRANRANR